jgi:hypothetical protein
MRVEEKLPFEDYNRDSRFAKKKPRLGGTPREGCGDNIYYKRADGRWKQRLSFHRHAHMPHDLRGKYVLIAREFFYFGAKAPIIPSEYDALIPRGRGHRSRFNPDLVQGFLYWLRGDFSRGVLGEPWEATDPNI